MFKYELGQEARDSVTGYVGYIIARGEHLTGCNTYGVQRKVRATEEKIPNAEYFDENRLIPLKNKIKLETEKKSDKGGPQQEKAIK